MDHKLLLAKCVTLLFKEAILNDPAADSKALVTEAVSKIQPREIGLGLGSDKDVVDSLKETVKELLITQDQSIDKATLLQRIRINVGDNDKLYNAIERGMSEEQTPDELRKAITSHRKSIESHLADKKITDVLMHAHSNWNYNRDKIGNTQDFLTTVWSQLEPLATLKTREDAAIIDEIKLSDMTAMKKVVENFHVSVTENRVYKTGWQGLNRMLQGGIRPAEFWVQAALQHKYKTGLSQSLFNQIALYNKPMRADSNKKPALIMFSFEDRMEERFKFIFTQLMYTETRMDVDVSNYSVEQIQDFVLSKLSVNGFELFFYRVDPTRWSYVDIFNRVIDLESKGYAIEMVFFDYLEKLPTVGCNQSGPSGNDILDLFSRVRNFFSARGIAVWTPHQLNTEAKKLIRGSVTEDKFVQALVGRGYYKGTSQLDQIPDGIILTHIFPHGDDTYLAIQRDRHRISSILDEKYKHMYLKFSPKMPLPDDLYGEDSTVTKLPPYRGNASESLFSFDS